MLVAIHKEQQRIFGIMTELKKSAAVLSLTRSAMEASLGIDHEWNMEEDYDPDDPIHEEKRAEKERHRSEEGDNPLRQLFGG